MDKNQKFSPQDLRIIRSLDDFDLTMFLSETHDHGISAAMKLLREMVRARLQKVGIKR